MAAWGDFREPSYIPPDSMLYFGADPCHHPGRESQHLKACSECGGVHQAPNGRLIPNREADPVARLETVAVVCGGCQRSPYDGTKALERAGEPVGRDVETDRKDKGNRTKAAVGVNGLRGGKGT